MKKTKKELEKDIEHLERQLEIVQFYKSRTEEKCAELVRILQDMRNHHNVIDHLFSRCTPGEDHA